MLTSTKHIAPGTKVEIAKPGSVPTNSTWDDDGQRTSTPVKRRLQTLFFKGDKRIRAEVLYIGSDSERAKLRSQSMVKLQIRDAAGSTVVITAGTDNLQAS